MADGLDEHERAIQDERRDPRERELRGRPHGAGHRGRVAGEDEREDRKRRQYRERRARPFEAERLHAVAEPTHEEAEADDPVADDHDRREHGVARERRLRVAHGEHHRDDQRDLDHGHRDREHERAERLADPVRDDFGVVDRCEHGAAETRGDDGEERRRARRERDGRERRPRE